MKSAAIERSGGCEGELCLEAAWRFPPSKPKKTESTEIGRGTDEPEIGNPPELPWPRRHGLAVRALRTIVVGMSTVTEIEAAIEKLPLGEQRELADWLNSRLIEETPEMLAMLDAGIRSLETEPGVPIEDMRRKIKAWTTG